MIDFSGRFVLWSICARIKEKVSHFGTERFRGSEGSFANNSNTITKQDVVQRGMNK